MKKTTLLLFLCLLLAGCAPRAYSDPFAYCAAVGQVDAPDARYTGERLPDALFLGYLKTAGLDPAADFPPSFKEMTSWRCMGGQVYACNVGANIPCDSKADTSQQPSQPMRDYCAQNPGAEFIPMFVTGHNIIYNWSCDKTEPRLGQAFDTVDAAGYQASFWQLVPATP